ncbi:hypothetical protein MTR_3g434770 [Medicago truncatula]|uniref:Uncharacterized protein n=1 Tax=Medicago truncatula TaxID=3880 RepID=A0A072UTV0_MEDTR|nr:hypothetical protein MTR_3g434770 [Medicago truncatula]
MGNGGAMESRGWADGGGAWEWRRRLLAWEEELVSECASLLHNVVLQDNTVDRWRWLLDPLHGYSVKGTYAYLTTPGPKPSPLEQQGVPGHESSRFERQGVPGPEPSRFYAYAISELGNSPREYLISLWRAQENGLLAVANSKRTKNRCSREF